jgi:hypothetical protein
MGKSVVLLQLIIDVLLVRAVGFNH